MDYFGSFPLVSISYRSPEIPHYLHQPSTLDRSRLHFISFSHATRPGLYTLLIPQRSLHLSSPSAADEYNSFVHISVQASGESALLSYFLRSRRASFSTFYLFYPGSLDLFPTKHQEHSCQHLCSAWARRSIHQSCCRYFSLLCYLTFDSRCRLVAF